MYKKNSCCSYCGDDFVNQVTYPRICFHCNNETYDNPSPCVVLYIDVWENNKSGTLVQRRAIEPNKDQWALTSGYMNKGETWEETSAREVYEEIGLITDPKDYSLLTVKTSESIGNLLIFGILNYRVYMKDIKFVPNEELSEIKVIYEPIELAFPIQNEMLKKKFNYKI
jgi:8-oxo-dGTP diphosphatase